MSARGEFGRPASIVVLAVTLLGAATSAWAAAEQAEVIFSNLGPKGNLYFEGGISELGKNVETGPFAIAFAFRPSKSYQATKVELALAAFSPTTSKMIPAFHFVLAESTEKRPGKPLFQSVIQYAHHTFKCCPLVTISLSPAVPLQAHRIYWLEALATDDEDGSWQFPSIYSRGLTSESFDSGQTWNVGKKSYDRSYAAFAVYGTPAADRKR